MGCIYKLTSPSGKSYIGMTTLSLEQRWAKHVEHALGKRENGYLYSALRKYGPKNFVRELLVEHSDPKVLAALEIEQISTHRTYWPSGYNLTTGGEYPANRIYTNQARANISAAQKKRFADPAEREKARAASQKGVEAQKKKWAPVQAAKKEKQRAWVESNEFKIFRSGRIKEGMAKPEVRAKIEKCAKERAASSEWRECISASRRGQKMAPQTEDHKRRIAEARKREWADPVIRERRLAALRRAREAKAQKCA